jgi:hypothetical protein
VDHYEYFGSAACDWADLVSSHCDCHLFVWVEDFIPGLSLIYNVRARKKKSVENPTPVVDTLMF